MLCGFSFWDRNEQLFVGTLSSSITTNSLGLFFEQIKESREVFTLRPQFYAFLMLSTLTYPILTFLSKLVPIWFAEMNISGDWFAGYNIAFGMGSLVTGLFVSRLLGISTHPKIIIGAMLLATMALIGMSLSASPQSLILCTFSLVLLTP